MAANATLHNLSNWVCVLFSAEPISASRDTHSTIDSTRHTLRMAFSLPASADISILSPSDLKRLSVEAQQAVADIYFDFSEMLRTQDVDLYWTRLRGHLQRIEGAKQSVLLPNLTAAAVAGVAVAGTALQLYNDFQRLKDDMDMFFTSIKNSQDIAKVIDESKASEAVNRIPMNELANFVKSWQKTGTVDAVRFFLSRLTSKFKSAVMGYAEASSSMAEAVGFPHQQVMEKLLEAEPPLLLEDTIRMGYTEYSTPLGPWRIPRTEMYNLDVTWQKVRTAHTAEMLKYRNALIYNTDIVRKTETWDISDYTVLIVGGLVAFAFIFLFGLLARRLKARRDRHKWINEAQKMFEEGRYLTDLKQTFQFMFQRRR